MAWTANLTQKLKENGRIRLVVQFVDGSEVITKDYFVENSNQNKDWLTKQIKDEISRLTNLYTMVNGLNLGSIDPTSLPEVTESQDEIDRKQFLEDYYLLQRLKKSVETGVLSSTDKSITDLELKVKTEYKPEYINLL